MTVFPSIIFEKIGAVIDSSREPFFPAGRFPAARSGSYRRDVEFLKRRPGTRVVMRAERGITPGGFLHVPFRFQHPPLNDFTRPLIVPWPVFETLSAKERSRPQGASLMQWTLNTYFHWAPDGYEVWTGTHHHHPNPNDGCYEPQLFVDELNTIAEENVIFRLYAHDPIQWGPAALVNSLATIVSIQPSQHAGEVGTEYVTIVFQQFREISEETQRRGSSRKEPTTYTPNSHEDLYAVAQKMLGKPSEWRRIAAVNGIANVSPDSASALQTWLTRHHKTTLKVPPVRKAETRPTVPTGPGRLA